MALHDADSHSLVKADPAPSLPDPVSVPNRTMDLTNPTGSTAVWTSTGALPFQVDGAGAVSLTVPRGGVARVQSNGARWVLIRPVGSRPGFAATAVTDASGNAVFSFPTGLFPAAPVVTATYQGAASNQPVDFRVTALTATSCTVNVRQSPVLVVLSLSVLGVSAPLAGATVHLLATPAGTTP